MAGPYAGKTVLGDNLNKAHGNNLRGNISAYKFKRAIIKESYQNTYFFYMQLVDTDGTPITKPIRLVGENHYLAMIGEPSEFIGKEVIITYRGTSVNRGTAQLMGSAGATITSEIQESEFANKLEIQGTSFAPPVPV